MTSSRASAVLVVYYVLFFIALFLISVRIYVRARVTQGRFENWGWDETTIVIAQVGLYCLLASSITDNMCEIGHALFGIDYCPNTSKPRTWKTYNGDP